MLCESKGLPVGRKQSKLPVIQGGMGVGISLSGLAGAVASCGGVGLISAAQIGFRRPEFDRDPVSANIASIKRRISKGQKNRAGGDHRFQHYGGDAWL